MSRTEHLRLFLSKYSIVRDSSGIKASHLAVPSRGVFFVGFFLLLLYFIQHFTAIIF